MDDKSDPPDGWPLWEVHRWPNPAKEDRYGKLFAYLRHHFAAFIAKLRIGSGFRFVMHCVDAMELPEYLEKDRFTRIEV